MYYLKGINCLQNKFLQNLFLRVSGSKILHFAECVIGDGYFFSKFAEVIFVDAENLKILVGK